MSKLERSTETLYFEQGFDIGLKSSHSNVYVLCPGTDEPGSIPKEFIIGERAQLIHLRDFLTKVIDGEAEPEDV